MDELYRTFTGKLGVDHRNGYIISEANNNELKIEFLSVYNDEKETITFIAQTDEYSITSSWTKELAANLLLELKEGAITLLAQYDNDDPHIRQREYDRRKNLVAINFRIEKELRDSFREKCEAINKSQSEVLNGLVKGFVKS